MTIRGGGYPTYRMAFTPQGEWVRRPGAPPADASDCIMVWIRWIRRIQVRGAMFRALKASSPRNVRRKEKEERYRNQFLTSKASYKRYAVSNDSVTKLIQPGTFDDQLTDVLRNGAHALLAHAAVRQIQRLKPIPRVVARAPLS